MLLSQIFIAKSIMKRTGRGLLIKTAKEFLFYYLISAFIASFFAHFIVGRWPIFLRVNKRFHWQNENYSDL
jgi:hypothetical protein